MKLAYLITTGMRSRSLPAWNSLSRLDFILPALFNEFFVHIARNVEVREQIERNRAPRQRRNYGRSHGAFPYAGPGTPAVPLSTMYRIPSRWSWRTSRCDSHTFSTSIYLFIHLFTYTGCDFVIICFELRFLSLFDVPLSKAWQLKKFMPLFNKWCLDYEGLAFTISSSSGALAREWHR